MSGISMFLVIIIITIIIVIISISITIIIRNGIVYGCLAFASWISPSIVVALGSRHFQQLPCHHCCYHHLHLHHRQHHIMT